MRKYVIKNCSAYREKIIETYPTLGVKQFKDVCAISNNLYCKDNTDCVLKRIVELCKEQACLGIDCAWCADKCNLELVKFANKILELLGIEEIKNENR